MDITLQQTVSQETQRNIRLLLVFLTCWFHNCSLCCLCNYNKWTILRLCESWPRERSAERLSHCLGDVQCDCLPCRAWFAAFNLISRHSLFNLIPQLQLLYWSQLMTAPSHRIQSCLISLKGDAAVAKSLQGKCKSRQESIRHNRMLSYYSSWRKESMENNKLSR